MLFAVLLLLVFSVAAPTVLAAGADLTSPTKTTFNMTIAYGITSAAALLLAGSYGAMLRKKNPWMLFLFISVVVVNLGYFALSISNTLEEALLANRISYLGSVFLPLCMLMAIVDVCHIRYSKVFPSMMLCISIAVFLLAASPGYLDCYYSEVSLVFINGMAKLQKTYGPLHFVYLLYLLSYFGLMLCIILKSIREKAIPTHKHAVLLLTVVLLNIAIWGVEQLVYIDFEILSVSYIISELLLLMLYGLMQDYDLLAETAPVLETVSPLSAAVSTVETVPALSTPAETICTCASDADSDADEDIHSLLDQTVILSLSEKWTTEYTLTNREAQVLVALLQNKRRKEIAVDLNVTEHTIKKHTRNVFSQLDVASRAELFALADRA
ncbi:MAG: hypothetical protein IKU27_01215 [Clostridia bacterium]|nr:hypothetical protein [Clostridia bacterium]